MEDHKKEDAEASKEISFIDITKPDWVNSEGESPEKNQSGNLCIKHASDLQFCDLCNKNVCGYCHLLSPCPKILKLTPPTSASTGSNPPSERGSTSSSDSERAMEIKILKRKLNDVEAENKKMKYIIQKHKFQ